MSEDISSIQSLAQRFDDLSYDGTIKDPPRGEGTGENFTIRIANLSFSSGLSINNYSQVAFVADLNGAIGDGVIIAEPGRELAVVALSGNEVGRAPENTVIGSSIYGTVINRHGQVAIRCFTSNGSDLGRTRSVLRQSILTGEMELIAAEGGRVPGTDRVLFFGEINAPSLNEHGQIAFEAALKDVWGVGVGTGVFAADIDGTLQAIAVPGQVIDVGVSPFEHDLRTITSAKFVGGSGGEDSRGDGLNDSGQIAFLARFGDASGVFVSDAIAIPEPSSMLLISLACVLLCLRKDRPQRLGR